jgi:tRNA G10  N-methylase Trm11
VGTFAIERNLWGKTADNYAVDIFGEAIAGARENAKLAGVDCNFVMKDFTQFSSKHLMTEIYADMPRLGKRTREELDALYRGCFDRFQELLASGGYLFLYSDEEGFVKKNLRLHTGLSLVRQMEIRPKEESSFYIIRKK